MNKLAEKEYADPLDAVGDDLPPGTELCHGQYRIDSYLNSGGFGITYLARDSLGRKIVIKECFPGAMCRRSDAAVRLRSRGYADEFSQVIDLFEKEARALAVLSHPNIVGVHQIFKDNGTAYMALDFVEGRDLLQVLEDEPERLSPEEIRRMLVCLLDAIAYVHADGILHRDISPDNILLGNDGVPVLIDFGAARQNASRASRVLSRVHTVKDGYSPQEFYLAGSRQEPSSDLYALAATIYHLITGEAPPNSHLRLAAEAQQQPDPYVPLATLDHGFEPEFAQALDRCLNVFPRDRIASAEEWRDLIDERRRQQVRSERVLHDREIDLQISQLVAEVSAEIELDPAQDIEDAPEPPPTAPVIRLPQPEPLPDAEPWDDEAEDVDPGAEDGIDEAPPDAEPQPAPRPRRRRQSILGWLLQRLIRRLRRHRYSGYVNEAEE